MYMTQLVSLKWGEIVTKNHRGRTQIWKDCMITSHGSQNWNWRLDGTKHVPGVTIAAILPLQECSHIVIIPNFESTEQW